MDGAPSSGGGSGTVFIADVTCNASHGAQDDRFSDISLGDRNLAGWPSKTLLAEVPENPEHEGNCQRGGN